MPQTEQGKKLENVQSINDAQTALGQPISTEQMKQIIIAQSQGTLDTLDVSTPDVLTTQDLEKPKTPVVPPNTPLDTAGSLVSGTQQLLKEYNEPTPEETKRKDLTNQLTTDLETVTGKGDSLIAEENRLGVPQDIKRLKDLNVQIAQASSEFDKMEEQLSAGTGLTTTIAGKTGQLRRQKAVEIGGLATMAQALQGNIQLAQSTAERTVNLQYAEEEQRIENTKTLLDLNYQDLTRAEKKKADILSAKLTEQQNKINDEKAEKTSINNIAIEAIKLGGATQQQAKEIMESGSYEEAIAKSAKFLPGKDNTSKIPQKIGQDSKGKDLFYQNGKVVTGDQLLGIDNSGYGNNIFSGESYDWATSIRDGQSKLSDISGNPTLKSEVVSVLNTLPPTQAAIDSAQEMIDTLKKIYNPETGETHPGLNSAVGSNILGRIPLGDFATGQKDNFMALTDQVISKEALSSLIKAKSEGATFGALSDTEMAILKSAAISFGGRQGKTGYDVTQDFFKAEIKKFINDYEDLLEKANDPLGINGDGGDLTLFGDLDKQKDGTHGGQCGAFVNQLTGLGLGDSYQSKLAKMDRNITYPEPGMVFVSPYKDTGHTGFVLSVNPESNSVVVKDSNYGLDEKIRTRVMPIDKITGLARA
jgi:hypothetical protein